MIIIINYLDINYSHKHSKNIVGTIASENFSGSENGVTKQDINARIKATSTSSMVNYSIAVKKSKWGFKRGLASSIKSNYEINR